jgi:hypothetical protein
MKDKNKDFQGCYRVNYKQGKQITKLVLAGVFDRKTLSKS